jgi:hypothetical protein
VPVIHLFFCGCVKKASVSLLRSSEWQHGACSHLAGFGSPRRVLPPRFHRPCPNPRFPLIYFSLACSRVKSSLQSSGHTLPPSPFPLAGSGIRTRSAHRQRGSMLWPSISSGRASFLGFTVRLCRVRACSSNFSHRWSLFYPSWHVLLWRCSCCDLKHCVLDCFALRFQLGS